MRPAEASTERHVERQRPDLMAMDIARTDEVDHVFADCSQLKRDCVSDPDFDRYGRVVDACYGMVRRGASGRRSIARSLGSRR